ncbi:MAG: TonB-dependent receptor plug domain-containing protein [Gemmatimonadaceae bacterium]
MTSVSAHVLPLLGLSLTLFGACRSAPNSDSSLPPAPVADVTSEDIERAPSQSVEDLLKGRVAGVVVTETPGGISVRIRGVTSFYGSNEPLYVLDGVPITPGPGGTLTGLSPHDIESIEVLKDPVDTSLYGMRGANGVIVIRTKRPQTKQTPS